MYTLYYSPGACSMAVHVLLNELNQPVKLVNVSLNEGKNKDQEFLKINPRGQVPVLVDDDHVICEGAAIMVYLMDKHGSAMLPKSGFERADALQWLMFGNATLHPAYGKVFGIPKTEGLDEKAKETLYAITATQINLLWEGLNKRLAKNDYISGKEIGAADILITVIANWNQWLGNSDKIVLGDNVKRLIKNVVSRPAYKKALAAENVEYKAAA